MDIDIERLQLPHCVQISKGTDPLRMRLINYRVVDMSNEVAIRECENGSFQNQASDAASSSRAQRAASKSAASTWKDLKARRRP